MSSAAPSDLLASYDAPPRAKGAHSRRSFGRQLKRAAASTQRPWGPQSNQLDTNERVTAPERNDIIWIRHLRPTLTRPGIVIISEPRPKTPNKIVLVRVVHKSFGSQWSEFPPRAHQFPLTVVLAASLLSPISAGSLLPLSTFHVATSQRRGCVVVFLPRVRYMLADRKVRVPEIRIPPPGEGALGQH